MLGLARCALILGVALAPDPEACSRRAG